MWPPMSLKIPFGTPVVPEVYKIYAGSFASHSTQSTAFAPPINSCQSTSSPSRFALCLSLWKITVFSILCFAIFFAPSRSGLYYTTLPGSNPHDADKINLAFESSIRLASSFEANPPNTTEWTAPIRPHASIAIIASGIIGI